MVLSRANFIFQDKLENVAEHQVLEEGGHRCDNSYALMTIKTAKVVYYLLNKLGSTAVKAWSRPTTISNWFFNQHYFFWVHIHKEAKNQWNSKMVEKLNVNSRMTWEYCWRVGVKFWGFQYSPGPPPSSCRPFVKKQQPARARRSRSLLLSVPCPFSSMDKRTWEIFILHAKETTFRCWHWPHRRRHQHFIPITQGTWNRSTTKLRVLVQAY